MKHKVPVLLAEDHEDEVFLVKYAFQKASVDRPIIAVRDGEEAVSYLRGHGTYSDRSAYPLPCLVLTDLKMPGFNGFDLLRWMQEQPDLKQVPTVVISGSGEAEDEVKARNLGARDYYVKPSTLVGLIEIVRDLEEKWLKKHCN